MDGPETTRLVKIALRCYPARWQRRHADEAAELAVLLMRDGTSAGSIALSYLAGATREWLMPRPGRRVSAVACALLAAVCSVGVSVVLLASTAPARAASTNQPPAASTSGPSAASTSGPSAASTSGPSAHCPPAIPVPEPAAATSRQQLIIREAWHDRSC